MMNTLIKFASPDTEYMGELSELSKTKIVLKFEAGIPPVFDAATVTVISAENMAALATYEGYSTIYQRHGNTVILSNDGSVCPQDDTADVSLDDLRAAKKAEIAAACQETIYGGVIVGGESFALTSEDQTNLFAKQAQLSAGAEQLEYHADGQPCRYYSAEEMLAIITAAMSYITFQTTRCNAMNMWIADASKEELADIFWGAEIPEAYQNDVYKNLVAAAES